MAKDKDLLRSVKERYRAFSVGAGPPQNRLLSEEDLLGDLQNHGKNDRLLGRFSAEDIRGVLAGTGVLDELARRGYPSPRILVRSIDPFRQSVKVMTSDADPEEDAHTLCDLRVFDSRLHTRSPLSGEPFDIDALVIDWLLFQDPHAGFTDERPRLPGQRFPGLGVMRPCMRAILNMAAQTGKEAVVSIPEYYHNAILYRPEFHFFDPSVEGRFLVLQRFLSSLALSDASGGVATEQIWDEAAGRTFIWEPHEQVLPMSPKVAQFFQSAQYRRLVEAAERSNSFRWRKD